MHACTDVTGFGLLGHLSEMVQDDPISIVIRASALPILPGALETAQMGLVPAGAYRNREFFGGNIVFTEDVPLAYQDLVFDPQTSGGLLGAIPADEAEAVIAALEQADVQAGVVGKVIPRQAEAKIRVTFAG